MLRRAKVSLSTVFSAQSDYSTKLTKNDMEPCPYIECLNLYSFLEPILIC